MYVLHDTHHGTVLSTFSSLYRSKMETKMCQFGYILIKATCSTSCQRFFEIHFGCREMNVFNKKKKDVIGEVAGQTTIKTITFQLPPPTYE